MKRFLLILFGFVTLQLPGAVLSASTYRKVVESHEKERSCYGYELRLWTAKQKEMVTFKKWEADCIVSVYEIQSLSVNRKKSTISFRTIEKMNWYLEFNGQFSKDHLTGTLTRHFVEPEGYPAEARTETNSPTEDIDLPKVSK